MNPKRLRRLQEVRRHASYTQLYFDLVRLWGQEITWAAVLTALVTLMLLVVWSIDFAAVAPAEQLLVNEALIRAAALVGVGGLLFYLAAAYARDPVAEVPLLAVYIMTALPRPYTPQRGLGYRQIGHLQAVARIEQDAADWRGSFVAVVILGALSLGFAVGLSVWRDSVSQLLGLPAVESGFPWGDHWLARLMDSGWYPLSALIVFVLVGLWMAYTLLDYARRFLGTEPANRIILMACEDALAFLEERALTEKDVFTLREKKAIAAHYRCRLVTADEAAAYDRMGLWGDEPSGLIWYIHPPAQYSRLERAKRLAAGRGRRPADSDNQSEDKGER